MATVLGIHGFSYDSDMKLHDTGAALVKDGKVLAAINEERLSRIKKDGIFPTKSIEEVLEITSTKIKDIDYVAFADRRPLWQLFQIIKYSAKTLVETNIFMKKYLIESLQRTTHLIRHAPPEFRAKPYFIEHHLAHASSAYYTSPWENATVVTIDGMGDYSIGGLIGKAENERINVIKRTNGFFSPGIWFMIITSILSFRPGQDEGKVMGLAAYGDATKTYTIMKELIEYRREKGDFYSAYIPAALNRFSLTKDDEYALYEIRQMLKGYRKEDIAAGAQKRLEDIVVPYVQDAVRQTGIQNVVAAGGIFANVKLNQKIMELPEVKNLYVHPNMMDGGLAVGAALALWGKINEKNRIQKHSYMDNVYLGKEYELREIERNLREHGEKLEYRKTDNIEKIIARLLLKEYIVGHFHGRMEYGPRALGNRSILADPRIIGIKETLNRRLNRTEFMPFAPAILEEFAGEYLDGWSPEHYISYFMIASYPVKEKFLKKAPGVVHVDGTVRPQIVNKKSNKRFYEIIKEFYKLTDVPLIINTSFNKHGQPIIEHPKNAITSCLEGRIDVLAIGDFLVVQKENASVIDSILSDENS